MLNVKAANWSSEKSRKIRRVALSIQRKMGIKRSNPTIYLTHSIICRFKTMQNGTTPNVFKPSTSCLCVHLHTGFRGETLTARGYYTQLPIYCNSGWFRSPVEILAFSYFWWRRASVQMHHFDSSDLSPGWSPEKSSFPAEVRSAWEGSYPRTRIAPSILIQR